ncbi:MAG: hypothetical protein RIC95_07870 [Vicingaceae bacterium]
MKKHSWKILPVLLSLFIASCTVVKNPQSANFQRVKYNSHLKLAKKQNNEKLPQTVNSFETPEEVEEYSLESVGLTSLSKKKQKALFASVNQKVQPRKANKVVVNPKEWNFKSSKVDKKLAENPSIWEHDPKAPRVSEINSYLNAVEPITDDSTVGLGDLLYVIVVVLLILIVISLIAELAGGLVGALIAVLLILLILRLLGYV